MSDEERQQRQPRTVGDLVAGMRLSTGLAVLGLIVVALGSLGPWVETFLGSVDGLRGDGRITLGASAIGVLAMVVGRGHRAGRVVAWIAAAAALGTAGYDFVHIRHAAAGATLFGHQIADVGWGPIAVLGGATAAVVALVAESRAVLRWGVTALALGGAAGAIAGGAVQNTTNASAAAASIPTIPSIADTRSVNTSTDTYTDTTANSGATRSTSASLDSGVAPVDSRARIVQAAACKGYPVSVGPATSCPFASNVFNAVRSAYAATGQIPSTVGASSPVTGKTYQMQCAVNPDAALVVCDDPAGSALVSIDESAVTG